MQKHAIPVHLETQDKLMYGLTVKQVMTLALGLTLSYSVWSSASTFGLVVSVLFGTIPSILALLVAFIKPSGTQLDEWFLIWLFFLISPRLYLWEMLPDRSGPDDLLDDDNDTPFLEEDD